MASKTLFAIPGTWEIGPGNYPDTPVGMIKRVTDLIDRRVFDVQHVNYPARFGPIAGNGEPPLSQLGSPSYAESVDMGVDEVIRLIEQMPVGRKCGVIGYSQGGAIAARVGAEARVGGRLESRMNDIYWVHTFGAPHRRKGHTFHNGNSLAGAGISGEPLGGFQHPSIPSTLDWFDYSMTDDIYSNASEQSYLNAAYELAKDMSLVDPITWASSIADSLANGEIAEAVADSQSNPILFGIKSFNTGDAVNRFINSGAHTKYASWPINGKTPTNHSANHLNYWGARR